MKLKCDDCGREHDPLELEPSFLRPDEASLLSSGERHDRVTETKNSCVLTFPGRGLQKHFLRVLLPVPVVDLDATCCWGIWVSLSARSFEAMKERWQDPMRMNRQPVPAQLANNVRNYPRLVGVPGLIGFRNFTEIPYFSFRENENHVLAGEARTGVSSARVLDWLKPWLHGGA